MVISSSIKTAFVSVKTMVNKACKKFFEKTFFQSTEKKEEKKNDHEDSLIYYEYTLHHKLRAAWARVHGLVFLLNQPHSKDDEVKIKRMLSKTLDEMDKIMNDVSHKLSGRKINSNR